MTCNRRRLREQLQRACGELVVGAEPGHAATDPRFAPCAATWSDHATPGPPEAIRCEEAETEIRFPWVLPEGLLDWLPDWGCRWIVQQGVWLPRPEESAAWKLRQLRIDAPQKAAGPHRAGVPAPRLNPRPEKPPAETKTEQSPGARPVPLPGPSNQSGQNAGAAVQRSPGRHQESSSCLEETAAGIPELYLELARHWREHPRWRLPQAALLCPVEPVQHQLQQLAIGLAGAVAHLEKRETLVVDFRPQAAAGSWWKQGSGLWELLTAEPPPDWQPLLRSTAYHRVRYLPRGRRRRTAHHKADISRRWRDLLEQWQERFAAILILGPQAAAMAAEQLPMQHVQCCLLAAVDSSSRREVIAAKEHLEQRSGSPPLCFALPDECCLPSPARAA